jgi:hypothetical protein
MPFHNTSSSVLSTALDIQHLLTPLTVIPGELHCLAVAIHLVYKHLNPRKLTIFPTGGVSVVHSFKYMCSGSV